MKEVFGIISKIIYENSQAIWTIISMVIGSMITFFTTYMLEKRKNKMQIQKEKLDKILIPYCSSLEQILRYGEEVKDLKSWLCTLNKPLEYLNADKRVYLSNKSRISLEEYEKLLMNFDDELNKNYKSAIDEYDNYVENLIMRATIKPLAQEIQYSMEDGTIDKIKLSILNKTQTAIISNITSVDFIRTCDLEYIDVTCISLDDETKMKWEFMNQSNYRYNQDGDHEQAAAYAILDIIEKNYERANTELNRILDKITMSISKEDIYKKIEFMRRKIISEIDKITK